MLRAVSRTVAPAASRNAKHFRQVFGSELEEVLDKYSEGSHDLAIDQKKESAVSVRHSEAVDK